ncbi:PTPLAD1 [Bugula neritina]|uniref:Very-long-chain (3R)-3-hydroxyacyl-CoA dehydratase n=1 Tax=Bugula neritina TaxID=10212 RepID=A0A7J7KIX6_BUGNE|nr:PTPLAD1 [Bugula neritina]
MPSASPTPSPFIYWGQSAQNVFIKIALKDVTEQPDVDLSNDHISFEGRGVGAHGDCVYKFSIKPYRHISPEKSRLRVTGSEVLLDIPKRDTTARDESWPRLTKDVAKHAWIRPDFDKMDISDDEEEMQREKKRLEKEYIDKLTSEMAETQDKAIEDIKKNYLFSYSLFHVIAYSFILVKVIIGIFTTEDYNAFEDVGTVLIIAQLFSFLEVVHPILGLVKSSFVSPLIQTCGRNFILLVVIWNEPRIHGSSFVSYLVLFWSLADVIRHPFYMLTSMGLSLNFLTWLRYTMWIPLYPLGTGCEWMVVWLSIPLYESSGKFSLELPNTYNFSISITTYMYMHLLIIPVRIQSAADTAEVIFNFLLQLLQSFSLQ